MEDLQNIPILSWIILIVIFILIFIIGYLLDKYAPYDGGSSYSDDFHYDWDQHYNDGGVFY